MALSPGAAPKPEPAPLIAAPFVADLGLCRRNAEFLTRWEADFVESVAYRRRLSPKQHRTLSKIARELRLRGCG